MTTVVPSSRLSLRTVATKSAAAMGSSWAVGSSSTERLRAHDHGGGKVEQLLLAAAQLRDLAVEPGADAKVACHLGHAGTHLHGVDAQVLEAKGQLVPHAVAHGLRVGVLGHKGHELGLLPRRARADRPAVHQNAPLVAPKGGQHRLEVAQQRGLSAAAGPADQHELAASHGQRHVRQRRRLRLGVGEAQMLDIDARHRSSPPIHSANGNAKNRQ